MKSKNTFLQFSYALVALFFFVSCSQEEAQNTTVNSNRTARASNQGRTLTIKNLTEPIQGLGNGYVLKFTLQCFSDPNSIINPNAVIKQDFVINPGVICVLKDFTSGSTLGVASDNLEVINDGNSTIVHGGVANANYAFGGPGNYSCNWGGIKAGAAFSIFSNNELEFHFSFHQLFNGGVVDLNNGNIEDLLDTELIEDANGNLVMTISAP
jgi:hypothetical protein